MAAWARLVGPSLLVWALPVCWQEPVVEETWLAALSPRGGELGNFAPDEHGRLTLAVPLLFAVKAAGPIVAVGIVAKGAEPEDWDKLAIAIVHLGRSAMLPNERRKLELHLVGARCWCRLCAARPFASALATLAFALALGRHQLDKDALLCSLGLELAQVG